MPRRCTVCDYPERDDIDEALVTGATYRSVAKRFGLSESAVYRHKTEHLPAHLLKAREVEEAARADDLLELVSHLQTSRTSGPGRVGSTYRPRLGHLLPKDRWLEYGEQPEDRAHARCS